MKLNDNVYDALKILLRISKNAQIEAQKVKPIIRNKGWLKEYCTVRASTARRGGHTTAILRLMEENNLNVGCFFLNHRMVKTFQDLDKQRKSQFGKIEFCQIFDWKYSGPLLSGQRFPELNAIIVDNSFYLSKTQEDKIFETAELLQVMRKDVSNPFFLIFLQ